MSYDSKQIKIPIDIIPPIYTTWSEDDVQKQVSIIARALKRAHVYGLDTRALVQALYTTVDEYNRVRDPKRT